MSATDILSMIFGGSKTDQQSTSSSVPSDQTPDAYKNLRDPFAGGLSSLLSQYLTTGGPQYGGPLTTPASGNENSILSMLMGQTGDATGRSQYLSDVIGGKYLPGGQNSNPFLDAVIKSAQRSTLTGLDTTLSRDLPGRFTAAGQSIASNGAGSGGSSAFDRAAATATSGVSQTLGDIATNIGSNAYGTERQLQQAAVPISQAEVDTTIKNLQAQALPRLIQENGIDRGIALFQQQTQSLLQLLQSIGAVAQPVIANTSQSQSTGNSVTQKGIIPALFPNGLGGGGGGGSGGSSGGGGG